MNARRLVGSAWRILPRIEARARWMQERRFATYDRAMECLFDVLSFSRLGERRKAELLEALLALRRLTGAMSVFGSDEAHRSFAQVVLAMPDEFENSDLPYDDLWGPMLRAHADLVMAIRKEAGAIAAGQA